MFAKLKKNLTKKILIIIWILFTSLYTLHGLYNFLKFQVYQAGANAAINEVIVNVASSQCKTPTKLFSGNVEVNLIDIACLQSNDDQTVSQDEAIN